MNRVVAVFCGNRAEFGLLQRIIYALRTTPGLEVKVVLSGALADPNWGDFAEQLLLENKVDYLIRTPTHQASGRDIATVASVIIADMASWLESIKANILLVLGDRTEVLAATTAAYFSNIVIAHIHGGDRVLTRCLDTNIRHAITKLAHLHFPVCEDSRTRILKMGESENRVFLAGSPAAELARKEELLDAIQTRINLGIAPEDPFILVTLHPENDSESANENYMRNALQALDAHGKTAIITYPNNDPGGKRMLDVLLAYKFGITAVIRPTLGIRLYLSALRACSLVFGNTSSGIVEAPIFKKPFVNIGYRQMGRLHGNNVVDCPSYEVTEIAAALKNAESLDCSKIHNPYDFGDTSTTIAVTLAKLEITENLLAKPITY